MHARPSTAAASRPPLLLSRLDVERIEALLEQPAFRALDTAALQDELGRAELAEQLAQGLGPVPRPGRIGEGQVDLAGGDDQPVTLGLNT